MHRLTVVPRREAPSNETSFCILGDPGEGDSSQYAVVRPMLARDRIKHFAFAYVLSDVIYPAGDGSDYPAKFYGPYHLFDRPIYAIPGNHDWDDGSLTGFMTHFAVGTDGRPCDAPGGLESALRKLSRLSLFWRGRVPPSSNETLVRHALEARDERECYVSAAAARYEIEYPTGQPGSYFRLRVGNVWFIGIDTGMTGDLDHPQAEWLLKASTTPGPKVLLTGKPLLVNGHARTQPEIDWADHGNDQQPQTVLEIIRESKHNYIATVGGDIHNYQRYSIETANHPKREIACLVAGGSGAFVASTELIGSDEGTTDYKPLVLYPSRGLSRVHFEIGVAKRLLSSGLLAGISGAGGLVLALLFLLPRGEDITWRSALTSFGVSAAFASSYPFATRSRMPIAGKVLWWLAVLIALLVESSYFDLSLRLVMTGLLLLIAVPGLLKVYELSRDLGVTACALLVLLIPLAASLVLSELGAPIPGRRHVYTAGYVAAIVTLALIAASLARKVSAREGATIREQRPYSSTVLGGSAWLLLMLILAASGRFTTLDTIADNWRQLFLLTATGAAVLAGGLVARPGLEWPLLWTCLIAILFVGGGTIALFGLGWHDSPEEQAALRIGLFEGTTAAIVGFLFAAAALSLYAQFRVLRHYRSDEAKHERVYKAEEDLRAGRDSDRHEFITTILRLIGRNDWVGPMFESREPPMLKSFLEVTVADAAFAAYRASGFEREADSPLLIDSITIPLDAGRAES